MVKFTILFRRAAGMTHEECMEYWRTSHAQAVRASEICRRYVRKYVQCEISACVPPGVPEYDGIAELWFDSPEDQAAFFADPEYAAALAPDESNFVDRASVACYLVEETPIV